GIAEFAEQFLWRIGKSKARADVLVIGLCPSRVGAVNERPQRSTCAWVWRVGVQNRLGAMGFMAGSIYVVTEAEIERQVFTELEIILHISGVVVLVPAWNERRNASTLRLRKTQKET